jgi:5-methylcytosine-specific restriction endonuclease McrA
MSYSEKLKDPRWQKKRLEILERDKWTCQACGDKETTLNVHHKIYYANKNPWDYEDDILITLCEDCHKYEKDYDNEHGKLLLDEIKKKFLVCDFIELCNFFIAIKLEKNSNNVAKMLRELYLEYFNRRTK